jgi:hypothetical protein
MFKDLWEAATGRWGLAAIILLAMPGSRKMVRTVAKEAVRAGLTVSESMKDLVAEIKEEADDVVAEIKAERKQTQHEKTVTASHKA